MMNNNIGKIFFWCQKILPLVYDNSLSYYEVLCKLQKKVNELVDNVNAIPEYIDDKVKEAFDDEHMRELISEVFRTIEDAITANNEGTNTNFSTDYPNAGTLVWHDNKLYKTKHPIDAGDTIIPDGNIELVNFGDMFDDFLTEVKTRFTDNDDGNRETSSADRPTHDLVWLNNELYEVIKPIAEGNAYIYSGANKNVESTNLDKIYDYLLDLISSEIEAREEADDTLQDNIDAEALTREQADDTLQGNIDAEALTREQADDTLQGNIDAEALAREQADNTLQGNIDTEALTREQADNTLQTNINNLTTEVRSLSKYKESFTNIKYLGAIGDGAIHPLSDFYSTLTAAKVDYPNAISLAQSIDSAALQKAINTSDGIYIPKGTYNINVEIILPQANRQIIIGDGSRTSILLCTMETGEMIGYNRDASVGGKITTFKDLSFSGNANVNGIYYGGVLVDGHRYEDNWLNIYDCEFTNFNDGVVLTYCGNCNFEHIYGTNLRYLFNLGRAASFIRAFQVFTIDVGSLLYADDPLDDGISNGIELIECEAIFSRNAAFRILGWQGVYLIRCSADLSNVQGDNVFIYKCEDVSITDCWIAGASAPNSIGLRLWESRDIYVSGCTVQNCNFGIRIDGLPNFKDNAITIHGCAIEGCANNDVIILNTRGFILSHNSFLDNITVAGTDAPVYCSNCAWSVLTENKFYHVAYEVSLAASVVGNNVFITS